MQNSCRHLLPPGSMCFSLQQRASHGAGSLQLLKNSYQSRGWCTVPVCTPARRLALRLSVRSHDAVGPSADGQKAPVDDSKRYDVHQR